MSRCSTTLDRTPAPPALFADAARVAWRIRTAEAVAAAAADQLRAVGGPDALVRQLEALARSERPTAAAPPGEAGAVLLVGCAPLVRTCLGLLLEARGVTVDAAADGYEAAERLAADRAGVRAVLVDAGMRGCPVMTAVIELRRLDPQLPVVLLGSPAAGWRADGVSLVVPAPFGVDDVFWALDEVDTRGGD